MGETRLRTATKAIGWQVLGLKVTFLLGWLFTGSIVESGGLSLSVTAVSLVTYFAYERVWLGVRWGRLTIEEPQSTTNSSRR